MVTSLVFSIIIVVGVVVGAIIVVVIVVVGAIIDVVGRVTMAIIVVAFNVVGRVTMATVVLYSPLPPAISTSSVVAIVMVIIVVVGAVGRVTMATVVLYSPLPPAISTSSVVAIVMVTVEGRATISLRRNVDLNTGLDPAHSSTPLSSSGILDVSDSATKLGVCVRGGGRGVYVGVYMCGSVCEWIVQQTITNFNCSMCFAATN